MPPVKRVKFRLVFVDTFSRQIETSLTTNKGAPTAAQLILSASKTSLDTAGQTTTDLLNTYSDDDYIKKIQKRLEENAFAREQREKRRRRLLMDQLIAHEAQEVRCVVID